MMNTDIAPQAALADPQAAVRERAASRHFSDFVRGYLTGLLGGGAAFAAVALVAVLFFPPPRTNILLLGIDRRPAEKASYVDRTDSMILATIYPAGNYVGLLAIPRDLYVTLPTGQLGRINSAHVFAEVNQPGSGPAAAMQVVRTTFGVDVQHYVRIDFQGFVRIIDALGGVDIDVPGAIVDHNYPTYDYGVATVEFKPGQQHMDGERALAFARVRHGSSDFARSKRQELVIEAVLNKLAQPGLWLRLPAILGVVQASVSTDLSSVDVLRLVPTLWLVGPGGVDLRLIDWDMVEPYTTPAGASTVLPVWEKINPVLLEMFGQ